MIHQGYAERGEFHCVRPLNDNLFPKSPAGCSADCARVDRDYASSWSIKCGLEEKPALVGSDVLVGRIKPFSQSQHGMVCGTEVDRIDIFHAFIADLAF